MEPTDYTLLQNFVARLHEGTERGRFHWDAVDGGQGGYRAEVNDQVFGLACSRGKILRWVHLYATDEFGEELWDVDFEWEGELDPPKQEVADQIFALFDVVQQWRAKEANERLERSLKAVAA